MDTHFDSPAPPGYTTVTPWIIGQHTVEVIDFIERVFDGEKLGHIIGEPGNIGHAEVRIGDAIVMLFDQPEWPPTPAFLRLYVPDAEENFEKAKAANATIVTPLVNAPWGDRVGRFSDPWGNLWWIHSRVEEVSDGEFMQRMSDPYWQSQMEQLQTTLTPLLFPGNPKTE